MSGSKRGYGQVRVSLTRPGNEQATKRKRPGKTTPGSGTARKEQQVEFWWMRQRHAGGPAALEKTACANAQAEPSAVVCCCTGGVSSSSLRIARPRRWRSSIHLSCKTIGKSAQIQ
jgi:hypothetical protein